MTDGDLTKGIDLVNVQYAVFFGVIFTFSFYMSSSSSGISVCFAIPARRVIPFIFLMLYYCLDWLTANYLKPRIIPANPWIVLLWILSIWYLGSAIVMYNSVTNWRYALIASYIIATGLNDLIIYRNICYNTMTASSIVWMILGGMSAAFGLCLIIPVLIMTLTKSQSNLEPLVASVVIVSFFRKMGRLVFLWKTLEVQHE